MYQAGSHSIPLAQTCVNVLLWVSEAANCLQRISACILMGPGKQTHMHIKLLPLFYSANLLVAKHLLPDACRHSQQCKLQARSCNRQSCLILMRSSTWLLKKPSWTYPTPFSLLWWSIPLPQALCPLLPSHTVAWTTRVRLSLRDLCMLLS